MFIIKFTNHFLYSSDKFIKELNMVRSLWTAASGMIGQQFNIDTISHNLSNVNTTGYKKSRADFEDLLYQNMRIAGTPSTSISNYPTGIHVGLGVKTAATQKMFSQGSLQNTNNPRDLAIEGEGFFKVQMYDGSFAYTRDGAWKIDSNGQMVNHHGYFMEPEIIFPEGFLPDSIAISKDGIVTCKTGASDEIINVGQIELYRFVNPVGLTAIGENLFKVSEASGAEIAGQPAFEGMGKLHQSFVEMAEGMREYMEISPSIKRMDSMMIESNIRKMGRLELLYTCLSNLVKELHRDGKIEMLEGLEHYADPNDRNRVVYHDREIPQAERLQKVIDDATELLPKCADEYADSEDYQLLERAIRE